MKNLQDYDKDELYAELSRRSELEKAREQEAQEVCVHEISGHLSVSSENDDHSGRDALTFEIDKFCVKCRKRFETVIMTTYSGENEAAFKREFEDLCRKYGRVYS